MERATPSLPTFAEYRRWLIEQGCTVRDGVLGVTPPMEALTLIMAPNGKDYAVVLATIQQETLRPDIINQVDARLGLVSPWSRRNVP